jgi:hypothetical protein
VNSVSPDVGKMNSVIFAYGNFLIASERGLFVWSAQVLSFL